MSGTKRGDLGNGIKNLKFPNDSKSKFLCTLQIIKEEGLALDELEDNRFQHKWRQCDGKNLF